MIVSITAPSNIMQEAEAAYGRRYISLKPAMPLNPAWLPLSAAIFKDGPTRLRDGGALNLTFRDALPDAWCWPVAMKAGRGAGKAPRRFS